MTLLTFLFNNTNGVAITTANSGLYQIAGGTGSTQTYTTASAYQGTTGAEFASNGTNISIGSASFNAISAVGAATSFRLKIPSSLPSSNLTIAAWTSTSGYFAYIRYLTTGALVFQDSANTTWTILTPAQAVAGSSFRIETVFSNYSATAGTFTCRAYSSGMTQVGTTASSSTANLGTLGAQRVVLGVFGNVAITVAVDSLQINDGSTVEIGEYGASSTPPTVTAGANQTTAVSTPTNITCTAVPAAGSIASYSWTLVSAYGNDGSTLSVTLTNATSQTASFTTSATPGRYIFQVTATDTNGNTSLPVTTRVFVPANSGVPIEQTSNSGWVTTLPVSIVNDSSDSTYAQSPAPGGNAVVVYRLPPLIPATSGFSLDVRSLVDSVGGTQDVALLEGATVRKDWGAINPGTTMGDIILSLSNAEMATIGSWNELDIRLTQV